MARDTPTESELRLWIELVLKSEELVKLSIKIEGNADSGRGYLGKIYFLEVLGVARDNTPKKYNLVLKCSKRNPNSRSKFPVSCAFLNESHFYEKVYPFFTQFQTDKCVKDFFDKVPKCYGALRGDHLEVIVFEDLTTSGYTKWDRKEPLKRQHVESILQEISKFHAISIAMKDQQPLKFQHFATKFVDFKAQLYELTDLITIHEELVDEIYDILHGDLQEDILIKWKTFRSKIRPFLNQRKDGLDGISVITHGDFWISNFLFHEVNNKLSTFAILDWQITKLSSPVIDLSYFLFACLSEEDINDIDVFLKLYHTSLSERVKKLGSDPNQLYPFDQLLEEWKKYSKFGVNYASLMHKLAFTEPGEVPDFVTAAQGGDIAHSLRVKVRDVDGYRKRMRYIVKYAVERDLV